MRAPILVCFVLLAAARATYRGPQQPQTRPRAAVYDVEVREVDAATLRQILAGHGQQGVVQNTGHYPAVQGNNYPRYPQGGQYPNPQHQQQPSTPNLYADGQVYRPQAGQTKAHFVSPNGQVYTLKEINGMKVLVGPDGRWHALNGGGAGNGGHAEPSQDIGGSTSEPSTPTRPGYHPPGPSGPNYNEDDDDDRGPTYDQDGGGPKGTRDAEDCVASITTYNGGRKACSHQLLLDEHFDVLNLTLWKHDVLMPDEPDFEFVAYDKDPDNSYVDKSILHIKPTLIEDSYGPGFVLNGTLDLQGCTSGIREQCTRTATTYRVLPSVRSARLTTRDTFTFRYGIFEARVLVPDGDWIYPAITLDPADATYGKWYASGQIRMPYALGNRFLAKQQDRPKMGLQVLRAGVAVGKAPGSDILPTLVEKETRAPNGTNWRKKHFRVYRMTWTPESIKFELDGKSMGTIRPPAGGFVSMTDSPSDHPWRLGTQMAPFDQEFFISLAVGVGGVNRFPDGCANGEWNEHPKPWKNSSPKALLDFYKARDHWIPTWSNPALEIAHMKVWAL